jgi:hypothetical protein
MAEESTLFVGFGEGEMSLSLWFADQTRRYLQTLKRCGINQELVRETSFPPEKVDYRRLAILCGLPTVPHAPHFHLIWDVPCELSDNLENRAELKVTSGLDESKLVDSHGVYSECHQYFQNAATIIELNFWPRSDGREAYFAVNLASDQELVAGMGKLLLRFLRKVDPQGQIEDYLDDVVIFSLEDGWKLTKALIRLLAGQTDTAG